MPKDHEESMVSRVLPLGSPPACSDWPEIGPPEAVGNDVIMSLPPVCCTLCGVLLVCRYCLSWWIGEPQGVGGPTKLFCLGLPKASPESYTQLPGINPTEHNETYF